MAVRRVQEPDLAAVVTLVHELAVPLKEWTAFRIDGPALTALARPG